MCRELLIPKTGPTQFMWERTKPHEPTYTKTSVISDLINCSVRPAEKLPKSAKYSRRSKCVTCESEIVLSGRVPPFPTWTKSSRNSLRTMRRHSQKEKKVSLFS